jgi:hypothetical protein
MSRLTFFACLVAFVACTASSEPLFAQFDDLVRRVPDSANVVVLINAEKLFESSVSKTGNWQDDREERFDAGLTSIPPHAKQLVMAAQLDLEFMKPVWEVAMTRTDSIPAPATIARKFGGVTDSIGTLPAVRLPDDCFLVRFSDQVMGGMAPANRQQVSRWLNQTNGGLSSYLKQGLGYADRGTELIMALDLTDSVTAADVQRAFEGDLKDVLKDSDADTKALAQVISSIKGVMLGVTFRDRIYGKIKVDFGQDATLLAPIAKPLLLAILANKGAMIDEFRDWKAEVKGTRISLGGSLTSSGVTRISSLIELPSSTMHVQKADLVDDKQQPEATQDVPQTMAQASQSYFQATQHLLSDLQGKKGTANNLNIYGVWFDRYATRVDKLPLLNVDPYLLDYGQYLSGQLRNASMAVKRKGMRSRVRQVNASANLGSTIPYQYGYSYGSGYRYGRYGAYGAGYAHPVTNNPGVILNNNLRQQQSQQTQIRAQEKAKMASSVTDIIQQIKTSAATVRREMTQKYQIEF